MLEELISRNRVIFKEKAVDWEDAIRASAAVLVEQGAIDDRYVKAMIDNVHEHGPYIVIAPNLAIPHARGDVGVHETAIAMMKLAEPVCFGDTPDLDAKLFFVIASVGADAHVPMLQSLIMELSDESILNGLMDAGCMTDVEHVLSSAPPR